MDLVFQEFYITGIYVLFVTTYLVLPLGFGDILVEVRTSLRTTSSKIIVIAASLASKLGPTRPILWNIEEHSAISTDPSGSLDTSSVARNSYISVYWEPVIV